MSRGDRNASPPIARLARPSTTAPARQFQANQRLSKGSPDGASQWPGVTPMARAASGEGRPDSGDLFEIGHAGAHHPLQSAEVLQQLAPLGRTESWNGFQDGFVVAARALAPVTGDRETMRLVADALDQPGCGRVSCGDVGLGDAMHEQPLLSRFAIGPLRHAHERQVAEPSEAFREAATEALHARR